MDSNSYSMTANVNAADRQYGAEFRCAAPVYMADGANGCGYGMEIPQGRQIDFAERAEKMYPDCYTTIYPHVRFMVNSLSEDSMYSLTGGDIDRLADAAMCRSGVLESLPAEHNRHTLGDVTRALVIRELIDRNRRTRFLPYLLLSLFEGRGRDCVYDWF
ncbi:MAG: hypothetical protein LBR85_05280 [Oscillospiraceae bacterium]|nr:hypothetical protein [Oscillospiraceae bacterium]